jgi:Prp8 binding protein
VRHECVNFIDFTLCIYDTRRWDVRKGDFETPDMILTGHTNTITGLSLNSEGTHLLSNGMEGGLLKWDVRPFVADEAMRCERRFDGARHGAEQVLLRCNWSPLAEDGSGKVACGSADR